MAGNRTLPSLPESETSFDITSLVERINSLEASLKTNNEIKDKKIENLEKKVENLQEQLDGQKIELDSLNQYGRRQHLEIVGIKELIPQYLLEKFVVDLLHEIGLTTIHENDLVAVHRLAKSKRNSSTRNVIVKSLNIKDAIQAYKSRFKLRKLNGKFAKLYFIEN